MDLEKPGPRRLYQVWKGRNRFLFGGRLIFGPDVGSIFFSIFLITGPVVIFCIKISFIIEHALRLNKNVIPWILVLVVAVALTILDMFFLFLTSSRDPGIVPRNTKPPESEETFEINAPSTGWVNDGTLHLKLPQTKDVLVDGHTVKVKFCQTCLLYRPPRASHCSICNNCVQRFDHHCPWIGQCIGIRNYRFFFMFISTSTILCIFVFTVSFHNVVHRRGRMWKALASDILSSFLTLYCFLALWFIGGLTFFHCYLIYTNQTTHENFRYQYEENENPYNKGMIENFKEVFFSKLPPSMIFRSFVLEDKLMVNVKLPTDQIIMERNTTSTREKIDTEVGTKFGVEKGLAFPDILHSLEYQDNEDNTKLREGSRRIEQESKESMNMFVVEVEASTDEKLDNVALEQTTALDHV